MGNLTDRADLAAVLEHLASKGTPGPWRQGEPTFSCKIGTPGHVHGKGNCTYAFQGWMTGEYWAGRIHRDKEMADNTQAEQVAGTWNYEEGGIVNAADAELIVALINNLPQILAALRRPV